MSLADVLARTAKRKEQGANQTYPQHARVGDSPSLGRVRTPTPRRSLPCIHEGTVLEWCHTCGGEAKHVRECDLHEKCTRGFVSDRVRSCERCRDYTTEEKPFSSSRFVPEVGDTSCGVVIGSYGWPELTDLQLHAIRDTCGDVPVCVSSDKPEDAGRLAEICKAHGGHVYLWPNVPRIGHTGGDLAAFWKGVVWGAASGLAVVAKLSQRWLSTRPRWLHDGARALLDSGLATAIRGCVGSPGFPLRTEAALLDVSQWNTPKVLARVVPKEYWATREGGLSAEVAMDELIRDEFGGLYWPWEFVPQRRREKPDGALWHGAHTRADYDALARRYGVTLPEGFHVRGWERERDAGEYLYG